QIGNDIGGLLIGNQRFFVRRHDGARRTELCHKTREGERRCKTRPLAATLPHKTMARITALGFEELFSALRIAARAFALRGSSADGKRSSESERDEKIPGQR